MRIAVVGAGGTGGYFGGLLARSGEDVAFIARGAHLAALRADGLTVKSRTSGDFSLPVRATDDPRSVGPVDLILFCVKAYDTVAAAEAIRPLVGPDTVLLSVQNGIDNEGRIASIIGAARLIGGLAGVSATIETPGVVAEIGAPPFIRFGEFDGGATARTERLLPVFRRAGIPTELVPAIRVAMWEKFLFICAFSGVTALTRLPVGPVRDCPASRALYRGIMEEVAAVADAHGIALPPDAVARWFELSLGLPDWTYGSMYHDLAAGRPIEIDSLNGTVVRLGREHGVHTPMNFAVHAALKPHAAGAARRPTAR